jgi:Ca2+-binding EF-hand superfamily protein
VMRLRLMFEQADQDADGVIGADDVRGMLRGSRKSKFQQEDESAGQPVGSGRRWSPAVSDAEVEQLLSAMDTDGDGVVTEDEFNAWASHFWQPWSQSSRLVG